MYIKGFLVFYYILIITYMVYFVNMNLQSIKKLSWQKILFILLFVYE